MDEVISPAGLPPPPWTAAEAAGQPGQIAVRLLFFNMPSSAGSGDAATGVLPAVDGSARPAEPIGPPPKPKSGDIWLIAMFLLQVSA